MFTIFTKLLSKTSLKLSHTTNLGVHTKLPRKVSKFAIQGLLQKQSPRRWSTFDQGDELTLLALKRKRLRSKPSEDKFKSPGVYKITAYPTCEEVHLEGLLPFIQDKLAFTAEHIQESLDVIRARRVQHPGCEPQEFYVFREGAIVLWNVPTTVAPFLLKEIQKFEQHKYAEHVITGDSETMGYMYNYRNEEYVGVTDKKEIMLSPGDPRWEKYVASHVLAATVKLCVWERQLEKYIRNIEFVTEDLKYGRKIKISQERVLRKHGALFALRHVINLSSSLLDPPQMMNYTPRLDHLYRDLVHFHGLQKRLRILRDKMNHCLELIMLLSTHLRDQHRLRLEWLVIGLVVVELAFEAFYCIDRVMG